MNKFSTIKPVLKLPGTKYTQLSKIYHLYERSGLDKFVDLFGGTGIVGVNIKNKYPNSSVYINDYDNLFPLTEEGVKRNLLTYNGDGIHYTKQSADKFQERLRNGLWDKVKIYQDVLDHCIISHSDYKEVEIPAYSFIYLDPPYYKRDRKYKNKVNHEELKAFVDNLDKSVVWVMSYDGSDYIREMYKDYYICEDIYMYRTSVKDKPRQPTKELWISNVQWNEDWK